MKKQYLLSALTFLSFAATSQTAITIGQTNGVPSGIALDNNENIYVAERSPSAIITKIDASTGVSTTFTSTGISDPLGITFGPDNKLYVADYGANKISIIPAIGGAPTDYVTGASTPCGLLFDNDTLYYIEYVSQIIYKVLPGGGAVGSANVVQISDSAFWMGPNDRGTGLELLADGNFFVSTVAYKNYKVNKQTGSIISEIDCNDYITFSAVRLSDNQIYLPGNNTHQIYRWDNGTAAYANPYFGTGNAQTTDGTGAIAEFNAPYFMTSNANDDLFVTEGGTNHIRKITGATSGTTEFKDESISTYPNPVSNRLQINLSKVSEIQIYSADGKLVTSLNGADNYNFDVSKLTNGLYFIHAENGGTQKFIKQ